MERDRWRAALAASVAGALLTGCAQTTLFKARGDRPDGGEVVLSEAAAREEQDDPGAVDEDVPLLDRTADEILLSGMEASFGAESKIASFLQEGPDGVVELDMHYDNAGRCTGTFSVQGLGGFEMILDGEQGWFRADGELVENLVAQEPELEGVIRQIEGRYRHVRPGEPGADEMLTLCEAEEFHEVTQLLQEERDSGSGTAAPSLLEKGALSFHEGREVITVEGGDAEMWASALVETGDEPYLRYWLIDDADADAVTEVWLSDFGVPVDIQVPPDDLVYGADELLFDLFGELRI
ncbi:hypothetical protein ACFV5N_13910 [Streptomyces sp. NPDC059853]|uniref:hypothetical protein n=1 Tax=Streptomyces sp. NPDC059853 TaxID=3346973 RepID=UPI0036590EF1